MPMTYSPYSNASSSEQLIAGHLPLVRKIAWHVHGRLPKSIDVEDLIQIGMVALVEASQNYEDRGFGFATYASMRIRGSLIDHVRKTINICRSAMSFQKTIRLATKNLEQKFGRIPTEPELAEAIGLDIQTFREQFDRSQNVSVESIEEVYSDHSMWFADEEGGAQDALESKQLKKALAECIGQLKERDAMVLQLYFVEEMNLDEIGQTLNVSAGRVCQIKKEATDKLRRLLTQRNISP